MNSMAAQVAPEKLPHILFISDAWHPQINGVVRTIEMTAAELQSRGYRVSVLGPGDFPSVPMPHYPEIRLALPLRNSVARRIEALAPDAIHIPSEGPLGWAARYYCRRRGLKFTTSYQTQLPEYVSKYAPPVPVGLPYAVLRRFHAAAAAVMVATPSVEKVLLERGFGNLCRWSRGVDTALFRPRPRPVRDPANPIMLSVGRLAVEKNLDAFLSLDLPGTKVVVGDGPERKRLEKTYPLVQFRGALAGEKLAEAYARADVFVFPSCTDTFGLVLLEALSSGVPVAAYPVPGPLDVLAGQDPAAPVGAMRENLGEAIQAALSLDPAACRAYALQHGWVAATDQFLAHLCELQ
jgi:glycosyltransferase involved in cell wall biosynthesis